MTPTSARHPVLKGIRRAALSGRPTADGLVVAEGIHLLQEALSGSWTIDLIVSTPAGAERYRTLLREAHASLLEVPARTFAQVASTETAQEVLCLLRPPAFEWHDLQSPRALIVVLDAIQDPGNAGTIVRSAEAFGATGLLFLEGSVRISNPKFLRATAGSLFRVPFLECVSALEAAGRLRAAHISLLNLTAGASTPLRRANLRAPSALVVGNEGAGISAVLAAAGVPVSIPTGRVESLNAGVACSLALYEAHNQRMSDSSLAE